MTTLTEQPVLITSITAAADLKRGRFINFAGFHAASGERAMGVCNADTAAGRPAPIVVSGIALVQVGINFPSIGAPVGSDGEGMAGPMSIEIDGRSGWALDEGVPTGGFIRVLLSI